MFKGANNDKTLQTLPIVAKLIYSTTIKSKRVPAGKEKKDGFNKETELLWAGRN